MKKVRRYLKFRGYHYPTSKGMSSGRRLCGTPRRPVDIRR